MKNKPKVAVLLASYNGEKWIEKQIDSIFDQKQVDISLFIRDDGSQDNTIDIINRKKKKFKIKLFRNLKNDNRSSAINFLNIVLKIDTKNYDFFSFADQDDTWDNFKLKRAINILDESGCDGYSSNLKILNKKKLILLNKSRIQKKYDFIFEGVAGCTIVLKKNIFHEFKKRLKKLSFKNIKKIWMHDWFIYFFSRSNDFKWIIDSKSYINYRQHNNNAIGANLGIGITKKKLKGIFFRINLLRSGHYKKQIITMAQFSKFESIIIKRLKNLTIINRIFLLFNVFHYRRSFRDCILMIILLFVIK